MEIEFLLCVAMHCVACQLGLFMFQRVAACVCGAREDLAVKRKSKGTTVLVSDIPQVKPGAKLCPASEPTAGQGCGMLASVGNPSNEKQSKLYPWPCRWLCRKEMCR